MLFEAMERAQVVQFIGPKKRWSHSGVALPLKFRQASRAYFAEHPLPTIPGSAPTRSRATATARTCAACSSATSWRPAISPNIPTRFETDLRVVL